MIKKFTSGNPIDTQAVVEKFNALPIAEFPLGGKFENGNFVFEFDMADSDIVYGLGEAPRGINKRGWVYNSFCSDDPFHTETKSSLYAAHNFLMLSGSKTFGIFIDFPSKSVGTSATQPQTKPLSQLTARILIYITSTAQSLLKS